MGWGEPMNREEALQLLKEHTTKESLLKHAFTVETAMWAYARKFGEDEESWGIVGLIHDFDFEKYPTEVEHPYKGAEILKEKGVSEEWIQAILGHGVYTGVKRESLMAKTLFAVDELTGFITAVALSRPDRKIDGLEVNSVKKKLKVKAFAASVNREYIAQGAEELGISLDEHIEFLIRTMQANSDKLGL